jgi:hypothetical protein
MGSMDLDTHASCSLDDDVVTPEDEAVSKALDLKLCESVGVGSFGGKR